MLASPRGEGRDEGRGRKRRRRRWEEEEDAWATPSDGKRRPDVEIREGKMERERKDIRESRIKVDQLHLQIAQARAWPASPSLWGSLAPDYMKLG